MADRVYVASAASKSEHDPYPSQHVFSSAADDSSFEVYPDPRGNTLGRGTEITLVLKSDASEFLEVEALKQLVYVQHSSTELTFMCFLDSAKHSSFSSAFPIYLYTTQTEEVPDVDEALEDSSTASAESTSTSVSVDDASETPKDVDEDDASETPKDVDEDEAIVEDVEDVKIKVEEENEKPMKMKTIVTEDWVHLNALPPIWTRCVKRVLTKC